MAAYHLQEMQDDSAQPEQCVAGQPAHPVQMQGQQQESEGAFRSGERWSFKAGTLCFGIPLYIHWLLPILMATIMGLALFNNRNSHYLGHVMGTRALLCLALPITVLLHELGHCAAAKCLGINVERILLWPLGGLAFVGESMARKEEVWVAVAGPLVHVPLYVGFALLAGSWFNYRGYTSDGSYYEEYFWQNVCLDIAWMQVFLFAFNLLVPAYPLDGGRILVCLISNCLTMEATAYITIGVCAVCCIAVALYAVLNGMWFTIVCVLWIASQCYQIYIMLEKKILHLHPLFKWWN